MTKKPAVTWLKERIAVALVSAVAAVLTLALFPIALLLIGGSGGGGGFELTAMYYAVMVSKPSIFIVLVAALTGFWVGPERMANIFSFFWGTHSVWSRLEAYLQEKLPDRHYHTPAWILVVAVVALVVVLAWRFHAAT